jgi:hypothetical protein
LKEPFLAALLLASSCAWSESSLEAGEQRTPARHRLDFSAVFLDAASSDSINGLLGYTYNLTDNSNLNFSLPYIDPDLSAGSNSGIGDMVAAYSIVPSAQLSANPWVPRTIGSGVAISIPTGSTKEGRSLGSWILYPYLGLSLPMSKRFFFAPQIGYIHSLSETAAGTDLRLISTETGFSFVALNGFWTSYFPKFIFDLKTNDWAINHRLSVGKMFSTRIGVSLDYTFVERFGFGSDIPIDGGYDGLWEVNFHITF